MLNYSETPIFELQNEEMTSLGIRLLIKREDLNHAFISGNKWWKLKYNLEEAVRQGVSTLLTFGGAYSNHIYSTAAAARAFDLKSIGIIRGEEVLPLNPTLTFAKSQGMQLHYISRTSYRRKHESDFIDDLKKKFGDFYLIPEGGTNEQAVRGCAEWGKKLLHEIAFDYLCLPVGTGGSMAGIICGLGGEKNIVGISVLKNGVFLHEEVKSLIKKCSDQDYKNWSVLTAYDYGGYGKVKKEVVHFIQEMKEKHNLPLDPVYTGKLLMGVLEEARRGAFPKGSTVLVLHTGGLQGAALA